MQEVGLLGWRIRMRRKVAERRGVLGSNVDSRWVRVSCPPKSLYRVYTKEWWGKLVVTPTEHQLWRLHSATGRCSSPFSQECTSASQSCSLTALDRTCCKRRHPPSPLATPFAGSNTMRFLTLGVYVPPLPMSLSELRDRITHALQTITADMLRWVWDWFDYRVDVCRVTQGAHTEGLWLTHEKLGQLPLLKVYVVPV